MPNFFKPNDKRAHTLRKKVLSGLVALLAASPLMADIFYISTKTSGKIGSLEFKNEDILQYDTLKNEWSILFDGSDVGLAGERIDGFYVGNDYILLSLATAAKLDIGGEKIRVRDSDIVKFNWNPDSSPGDSETKGTFELFFDGSDVRVKRDIDALTLDQDGRLVFSLNGRNKLPQAQGELFQVHRQDLVRFIGNTGPETNGYFELLFDGRKAGLNVGREEIDGVDLGGEFLYLTTSGNFNVGGVKGRNEDILRCDFPSMPIVSMPVQTCGNPQVIFNGSDIGLAKEKLQDIQVVLSIDVALNPSTVAENRPAATVVGNFATTNTDAGDTILYTLATGEGDTDNAAFQISGNQLRTAASFNFEAKSSYSIRVRSNVSDGRFFEKQFTITVQNANDAPTDLALSSASVAENQALGTAVGSFTTTDPDSGDTHTYTLAAGAGDTDNGAFAIVGNELQAAAVFDFETKASYSIRVRSTDNGGLPFEKILTITIDNGPDAPTDIGLTPGSVAENQASGTLVGNLTSTDSDAGDTHTYALAAGVGDTDNGAFAIVGGELRTAAVFNFETKASYSIRVRSTDNSNRFFEKTLTITITDANDAPAMTAGGLLSYTENAPATVIDPALTVTDVDSADLAGATVAISGNFQSSQDVLEFTDQNGITGSYNAGTGVLTLNGSATLADYQTALRSVTYRNASEDPALTARTVTWVVNDGSADSADVTSAINITPVNDTPVITGQNAVNISEDTDRAIVLADLTVTDPDNAYPADFTLTVGDGANYTHAGNTITPALDFSGSLTVPVVVNDGTNDSASFNLTVTVTLVNDAPTITGQNAVNISEDTDRAIVLADLTVTDPDNVYPADFTLTVGDGANYTHVGNTITPALDFSGSLTVPVVVNDGANDSGNFDLTVTVVSVNDVPVIANLTGDTLAYSQGEPARVIDQGSDASASDVDSSDFATGDLTVSLVNGIAGEDELGIRNQGNAAGQVGVDVANVNYGGTIIGSFSGGGAGGGSLIVTFNASADADAVTALLRNITYRNSNSASPDTTTARTVRFVLADGDGGTSVNTDATVTVAPNTPPTLTGGASVDFTEDAGAIVLDSNLTVDDANDSELESATVTIGNLLDTGKETLAANTAGTAITASYTAPTLTLTGTDTVANYQQVLRSVTYDNASQHPNITTARSIDFTVNDGSVNSNTVTTTLTVLSVNDAPSLTANNPPDVSEDEGAQTVNNWATFNTGAADESGQTVVGYTVSNVSNSALFSTLPEVADNGTLTYMPAANANGTSTFDVVVQDNGGAANGGVDTSAAQTFTITVTAVNDAPSFTGGGNQTVIEDAGQVTASGWASAISAGPNESGQTVSFVIDSNDNPSLFSAGPAVAADGTLTFTPAANLNGVANITLHAQDNGGTSNGGDNTSDTVNFTITVQAVNDPPLVTAPGPFSATGNVSISVPAPGLLTTVSDAADGTTSFTVNSAAITSAQGGSVTVDTGTGAFTYNPPAGYEGADSFSYQVCDTGIPGIACTSATVNLTVSGMIWFIDNTASAGDGRLSSPFNTLAAFEAVNGDGGNNPAAGDNIFLYESASAYTGPVTLLDNQKLLGQDATADLATMAGITLASNSAALPATNSANGTVVSLTSATDAIRISQGASNTLRGFTVGNVSASGTGINMNTLATSFGTLTVSDVAINTNGRALNLTSGTLNATFAGITSTGGANNLNLTSIAGTSNLGSGALSGASGAAFNLDGGAGSITYSGTITNIAAARLVNIVNKNGGSVTLSGNLSGTGSSTGVNVKDNTTNGTIAFSGASKVLNTGTNAAVTLDNNDAATISFSGGGLVITTTSGTGFNAINGAAAINVTGTTNTLASTSGTALNVASTNIGSSGLTFQSISAGTGSGSSGVGISLNSTGLTGSNGGLTVTGTGTAGSGGTIQHKTGADDSSTAGIGIFLKDTKNASFSWMQLNDFDNSGIVGRNVQGFTLQNSVLNGVIGSSSDPVEAPISFGITNGESISATNGLQGTGLIRNVKISGGIEHNVEFYNQSGSMSLTIDGSSVVSEGANPNSAADDTADCVIEENSAGSGSDGILMEMQGTATATVVIDRCLFRDNKSQAVQIMANDSSAITATIDESWARKFDQGNEGFILSNGSNGDLTTMISNNHVNNYGGTAIFVGQTPGNATASSLLNASIINNVITQPTTATNHGIITFLTSTVGQASQAKVRIDGNTVTNNSLSGTTRGIIVDTPDTNTSPVFHATVTNNSVSVGDNVAGVAGLVVQARQSSDGCANIGGNTVTFPNGNPGVNGLRARQVDPAVYDLEQSASCTGAAAAVLACRNPSASTEALGTINPVSAGSCLLPVTP